MDSFEKTVVVELQLVTFEQAKMLKDLGFPQENDIVYAIKECYEDDGNYGRKRNIGDLIYSPCGLSRNEVCDAPSLALVAKWLREKGIIVTVKPFFVHSNIHYKEIETVKYIVNVERITDKNTYFVQFASSPINSYEEALSVGIDIAIEILSNKQMENMLNEYADYEYVDLGLPSGTLWAKCNIGATSETEYGKYFMWGDIVGCDTNTPDEEYPCDWEHAPFNNGQSDFDKTYFNAHKSEWLDENGALKPEYDAAHVIMGGDWKMPTKDDFEELISNTTNEWVEDYQDSGVDGRLFTSKINGKTLFFPAAGCRDGSSFRFQGAYGIAWSSLLFADYHNSAWELEFSWGYFDMDDDYRYFGYPVRGILQK